MGRGGRVAEHRAFGRDDRASKPPPPFRSLGNFVHPTLPVSFGRDGKTGGPFCLVSMPGERKEGKTPVMDSLILEKDILKNQEDHIGSKCTLVCFNVLSSVVLDTKKISNNSFGALGRKVC